MVFNVKSKYMKKDILTEINVYYTTLSPQRGHSIDNEKIKAEAVKGYVLSAKRMEEKDCWEYKDYKFISPCEELNFLDTAIKDEFFAATKKLIKLKDRWVNVYEHLEQGYSRNNLFLNSYFESPWYTCIYCCDVVENSSELVIEYDDVTKINKLNKYKIENNKLFIFPSTLRYFFSENFSEKPNIFITHTYKLNI